MRALRLAGLAAVALVPRAASADVTFAIPDGWVEAGPSTPPERLKGAPDSFVEAAGSGRFAALAIDLAHPHEGVFPQMTARLYEVRERPFERGASAYAEELLAPLRAKGLDVQLRSAEFVEIDGLRAARLAFDIRRGDGPPIANLQYHVPTGGRMAVQSFYLHRDAFEARREALDAVARRTRGLARATVAGTGPVAGAASGPPRLGAVEMGAAFGTLVGVVGFVGLFAWLLRRGWRSAAGPAFVAGLACYVLYAIGSARRGGLSEWDPVAYVLASATWWIVFRRRDARARRRAEVAAATAPPPRG